MHWRILAPSAAACGILHLRASAHPRGTFCDIGNEVSYKELSAKAYSNMRTLIIGVFKYAKKKKYTTLSITQFLGDMDLSKRSFAKRVKDKESQVFFENEVLLITDYLKKNPTIENLGVLLAFQTGIREGELAGLKFSDVKGNSIHIQRMEVKYKDLITGKCVHEIKEHPKTDAGDRYIIITDKAKQTINQIREKNRTSDFMMYVNGKMVWTNTFNDRIYKACKAVGIPRRSMHKIRKTYGTTLLDAKVDESLIMEQMGHSDIATTRKYYYYSNKDQAEKQKQIQKAMVKMG